MKIILSRKGFDSGYGGRASPIFLDIDPARVIQDVSQAGRFADKSCRINSVYGHIYSVFL